MRKFWLWMIPLIVVAIASVGIIIGINVSKNMQNKVIFAENLYWKYEKLTLRVGVTYKLSSNEIVLEPSNCTQKILYSTDTPSVLEINALTGEIRPNEIGTCNLIASIKSSEVSNITIKIKVEVLSKESNDGSQIEQIKDIRLNISDKVAILEYETTNSFNACHAPIILLGNDIVQIANFAYKRIYISLKGTGTAKIVIDTPSIKTTFNISIE